MQASARLASEKQSERGETFTVHSRDERTVLSVAQVALVGARRGGPRVGASELGRWLPMVMPNRPMPTPSCFASRDDASRVYRMLDERARGRR